MWFLVYLRYFYGLPVDHLAASTAALQVSQPPRVDAMELRGRGAAPGSCADTDVA